MLEASKKKKALKKKLLEASLKKRALKMMFLEESKKEAKDANMASLVGGSIPAQKTFTKRKRPCTGSADLELTSKSRPTSSSSLTSLEDLEAEGQADVQCYGWDLPFPTEESLLLPNGSSSMTTMSTLRSRMPSIPGHAGSSQQRFPETSSCSSLSNSGGRSQYLCDKCGKLFKHPGSLQHHSKIHRGGYKCSACGKVTTDHLFYFLENQFESSLQAFSRRWDMERHLNKSVNGCSANRFTSTGETLNPMLEPMIQPPPLIKSHTIVTVMPHGADVSPHAL